jgi:hypothetical protein
MGPMTTTPTLDTASRIRSAERLRLAVYLLRAVQYDLGRDAVDTTVILDLERQQLDLERP